MLLKRFFHLLIATTLLFANVWMPVRAASVDSHQRQAAAPNPSDLSTTLASIEKTVDEKRKELGVPGISLVIVKDDRVIYMKGLGLKDVERGLPVTPDTLFAIGSCTKAFTAMAAMMSVDDGKLSLDDSPKKFLPYFKLMDAEADAKITIRDLLSHRSGLAGTDLLWAPGVLDREEIIRAVAFAKPTARLGEKFQYQNVMFSAAGEVVAKAQDSTWEQVIARRILKPLGMKASNTSIQEMQKASDFSLGYEYIVATKEARRLPMRDLKSIAPAGAINSSVRDMAAWVRLMLGGGVFEGKRLVSEKSFKELITKQINIAGNIDYGLGWGLAEWNGHKVLQHSGGIDGFNSLVALMPDRKLGVVMLTNVSSSPLGRTVMETVWSNLVGSPQSNASNATAAAVGDAQSSVADLQSEVGTYRFAEAGFDVEIALKDGKLTMTVPNQPVYALENVGGRRYKLANAPAGFFVTFRPVKENASQTEAYLEQPQGNYVLTKIEPADAGTEAAAAAAASYSSPFKDLLGSYEREKAGTIEIAFKEGKVALIVPGQPAYPLSEKAKDNLYSPLLPDSYAVLVKRDAAGKVSAIVLKQPEGEFEFKRIPDFNAQITVDELMTRVIEAHGGEANLRRHRSMIQTINVDFENQGVSGPGIINSRAPNATETQLTFMALGKKIGTYREFFDGTSGGEETSFSSGETKTGAQLDDARVTSDFYQLVNWKKLFKTVAIKRMSKVGDEEVYVVVKTPEKGNPITDYISAKSFLILKRDLLISSNTGEGAQQVMETYSDYKTVGGVLLPFKTVSHSNDTGDTIMRLKDVKFDVEIPDSVFRAQARTVNHK
ncbi:MAG TPA: serine hydrolase [Pyrinomonadaceae bacterium]|jgi:CubicO group peptidase (beta-lactamase class C family)